MKPVILEGGGIMLVVGDCSHEHEQVTHGPTTDQINHWCPDCRRHWTTWPERASGVAPCRTEQDCNQPDACRATGGCERVEDAERDAGLMGGPIGAPVRVEVPAAADDLVCRESMCANMESCQFPRACRAQPAAGVPPCDGGQP